VAATKSYYDKYKPSVNKKINRNQSIVIELKEKKSEIYLFSTISKKQNFTESKFFSVFILNSLFYANNYNVFILKKIPFIFVGVVVILYSYFVEKFFTRH
jgi:hypothetical protein